SPADWNSASGLLNALLPTLYFGHAVVSAAGRFSAERSFQIMERYQVSNTLLSPAELKAMMLETPEPRGRYQLSLRAITSSGAALDEEVFNWSAEALGVTPNEMFGQIEMNGLIGNSSKKWPARPGSMGRPYPGHQLAVLDVRGRPCPPGKTGE